MSQETKQKTFNILPVIGLFILVFVIYFVVNFIYINGTKNQIAYEITENQVRATCTIDKIIKENGKEDVYCLSIQNALTPYVEIPASTYEKYIGIGNNAFEYKTVSITFYVGKPLLNNNFKGATIYTLERYAFPWEDKVITFTDNEIVEFKSAIVVANEQEFFPRFTFKVDNTIKGTYEKATLPDTAKLWSERDSSKPAANNQSNMGN